LIKTSLFIQKYSLKHPAFLDERPMWP